MFKKVFLLSLVAATVVLAAEEKAEEQKKEAKNVEEAFKLAEIKGQIRAIYQSNSKMNDESNSNILIGGKLGIETAPLYDFSAGATFYTSNSPFKGIKKDADYYNQDGKDYSILGESFIKYATKNLEVKVGRMELCTPFANSDDIRMVPDIYTAAMANYKPIGSFTLIAGVVTQMAGWENSNDRTKFIPFTEVAKNHNEMSIFLNANSAVKDNPLELLGAIYEIENFSLQGWMGYIKDFAKQYYAELNYSPIKSETLEIGFAAQEFIQQTSGLLDNYSKQAGNLGTRVASKTYGVKIFSVLPKIGVDASFAYNKSAYAEGYLHNGGTMYFWGGGSDPLFTSADVQTADAEGGVKGYKATVGFDFEKAGIERLKTQLAHAYFDKTKANSGNYARETDLTLAYAIGKASIETVFSNIKAKDTLDNNRLRVFVKYDF